MKTLVWELSILGALAVAGAGCKGGGDTTDTDTDVTIPSTETSCTDGVDNDQDGDIDCADSDCTTASNCVPQVFTPTQWQVAAGFFAYDADLDKVVSYNVGGTDQPPAVVIALFDDAYQTTQAAEDVCIIQLTYNGTADLPLLTDATTGQRYVRLPDGQVDVDSTACPSTLDASIMGSVDDIVGYGWGIGVGTATNDITSIDTQIGIDGTEYVGGGWYTDWSAVGSTHYAPYAYSYGYAMDANYGLLNDAGQPFGSGDQPKYLLASDILATPQVLATGVYQVVSVYAFGTPQ